jgi:hypothetical protein
MTINTKNGKYPITGARKKPPKIVIRINENNRNDIKTLYFILGSLKM